MRELLALADDETRALWEELTLGYTETAGHPLLRAEIAALYPGLEAEDVLTFAGAQEALFALAMNVLLGPGTPTPSSPGRAISRSTQVARSFWWART